MPFTAKIAIAVSYLFALLLIGAALAVSADKPTPEQSLERCSADLLVTAQYAAQMNNSRNALEKELATVRAQNAALQAKVKELTKAEPKAEKPAK
jgi:septal ring factor EnvC (AmiA/AmiB activator)